MRGDPHARAGRQKPVKGRKPLSGEQARGPQHQVKPAASTYEQSGGRAAHVTAKAILDTGVPKAVVSSGGVWGAARVRGEVRNTGDPSAQPESGRGGSYKPKAKSSAVQRESEGIEVPQTSVRTGGTNAVTNNAAGGKGPCGDRAGGTGKREGMSGKTGTNDPGGLGPREKVRQLQRQLWAAAKRAPGRRFHALYDHIWRGDVLQEDGFDFLGCHLRKRLSGRIWEQKRKRLYFLHRWPSRRAMVRVRQRVKEFTPKSRCHADLRQVIADINPVLRGWGNYYRTGNAAQKFVSVDDYVVGRLRTLCVARKGRNLRAGEPAGWTREYFEHLGLHRLRGRICYPERAFWQENA
jgi:hypothetical protein